MFIKFVKFLIWIAILVAINLLILNYFGYTINKNFIKETRENCKKTFNDCKKENEERAEKGTGNTKCDYYCIGNNLIIKK